jgi:hypothetical protein
VQQRSQSNQRQTLRTKPVPEPLGLWLAAVNGLPNDEVLFKLSMAIDPLWVARTRGTQLEREQNIESLKAQTRDWGSATRAYIFRTDNAGAPEPSDRLGELLLARATLRAIVGRVADGVPLPMPVTSSGAELIVENGVIQVRLASFLRMLDGMEADRIRLCPICAKFFWAGRRDKSGCMEECSRVLRQRRLRANRAYQQAHPKAKRRKIRDSAKN